MVPSSGPVAPSQADFSPLLQPFICIDLYWERSTLPYMCRVNALPPSHTLAACVSVALSGDIEENKYLHIFRCISQGALFSTKNSVVSSFSSFFARKQSLIHSTLHLRKKNLFSQTDLVERPLKSLLTVIGLQSWHQISCTLLSAETLYHLSTETLYH